MFSAVVAIMSLVIAFLTATFASLVPLIIDSKEAKRKERRDFENSRRERIEAFIIYSAEPVASRKNIIKEYVELNKHYAILSHYCTLSEMQTVEKFIRIMSSTGNSNHVRRQAYREVCACLSKLNSPCLSEEDLEAINLCEQAEAEKQEAIENEAL